MGNEGGQPICNNATVNWLLNTALERISRQSEWMDEMLEEMKKMESELSESRDLQSIQGREIDEARKKVSELRSELSTKDARIAELEVELNKQRRLIEENTLEKAGEQWPDDKQEAVRQYPKDCSDIQENGMKYSGIYTIYPETQFSPKSIEVFCDFNTDGGHWTVIQRRQDGSESFERTWDEYKEGFGVLAKEFWLGNENILKITSQRSYELRIDMIDFDSVDYFATYSLFSISSETEKYRLTLGQYSGTAGDSMSGHDGWPFSTADSDNDGSRSGNCSKLYGKGGWWYARCYDANLNGRYSDEETSKTIVWFRLPKDKLSSLRSTEMKVRPKQLGNVA